MFMPKNATILSFMDQLSATLAKWPYKPSQLWDTYAASDNINAPVQNRVCPHETIHPYMYSSFIQKMNLLSKTYTDLKDV